MCFSFFTVEFTLKRIGKLESVIGCILLLIDKVRCSQRKASRSHGNLIGVVLVYSHFC